LHTPPPLPAAAYSVHDVAARLGISKRQVARIIAAGEIPSFTIGRRRLVRSEALVRWLDAVAPVGA
jgi:excisionase family DNA binding protein